MANQPTDRLVYIQSRAGCFKVLRQTAKSVAPDRNMNLNGPPTGGALIDVRGVRVGRNTMRSEQLVRTLYAYRDHHDHDLAY